MTIGNVLFLYLFFAFNMMMFHREEILTKFTWNRFVQDNTKDLFALLIGLIVLGFVLFLSDVLYLGRSWDCENEDGKSAVRYLLWAKILLLIGHLLLFRPLIYLCYYTYGEKIIFAVISVYAMVQICSGLYSLPVFHILNNEGKISKGTQLSFSILSFLIGIDAIVSIWAYYITRNRATVQID